jgi:hypothetical protein
MADSQHIHSNLFASTVKMAIKAIRGSCMWPNFSFSLYGLHATSRFLKCCATVKPAISG